MMFKKQNCANYICLHWREALFVHLCKDIKEDKLHLDSLERPRNNRWLFSHEILLDVLHQSM